MGKNLKWKNLKIKILVYTTIWALPLGLIFWAVYKLVVFYYK